MFRHAINQPAITLYGHPLFIRPRSTDILVFNQIFMDKEYDDNRLPQDASYILDCGANAGYSPIFFAQKYPGATVIAVEPDQDNFEIMQKNIGHYTSIFPIASAIWNTSTYLKVYNPRNRSWGIQVKPAKSGDTGALRATSVPAIMKQHAIPRWDIVKMDIEGAEHHVFANNLSWLDKIRCLVVEPHERYAPGCTQRIIDAMDARGFTSGQLGENLLFFK
jgi:FkbM family methyltransferase